MAYGRKKTATAEAPKRIRLSYKAVDGASVYRTFATVEGARSFAQKWVGETPELGSYYAVSGDGVGKLMIDGPVTWKELFPKLAG